MANPTPEIIGDALSRKRGDTAVDRVRVNVPGGIAGFSYLLSVNTLKKPVDETTQLFQSVGIVMSFDADGGYVEFPVDAAQADQPLGKYWYDIQQTDGAGRKKTIAKNKYTFHMDVTKD